MSVSMKRCRSCLIEQELIAFYPSPDGRDGTTSCCRACIRGRSYEYYLTHREQALEAQRQYRKTVAAKVLIHASRHTEKYRAQKCIWSRNRRARLRSTQQNARRPVPGSTRTKIEARTKTNNAIRDGRLQRESCEICGAIETVAHHDAYERPLDVRWLCLTHHHAWHYPRKDECNE